MRWFDLTNVKNNGITENELVLELQADDDSWTAYSGTVDEANNTVSYTFNDPVSFKAVTASSANAALTIEDIEQTLDDVLSRFSGIEIPIV